MNSRGWTPIYVDLWSDKSTDPARLIRTAIKTKINSFSSAIKRLARSTGLEKVNAFNVLSLNLQSLELPHEVTLPDAIEALAVGSKTPIALIVDEAQHALSTQAGIDTMFALKAARDQLNQQTDQQKLMLVFTGSHRDKLASFVHQKSQPFFGASVTTFPLLGKNFTDEFTRYINGMLAADNQFSDVDMFDAFKLVGCRPEMLRNIVSDIALNGQAEKLGDQLKAGAKTIKSRMWDSLASDVAGLSNIQLAVLETLIQQKSNYSPYSERSMAAYAKLLNAEKVQTSTIQAALDALRDKGLVWKSAVGSYALEDDSLSEWFTAAKSAR
jgi:hypothetical protein